MSEPTEKARQWTPELLAEFHDLTEAVDPEYNPWYYHYCDKYTPPNEEDIEKVTEEEDLPAYKAGNPMLAVRNYVLGNPENGRDFDELDPIAHAFYTPDGVVLEFETLMCRGIFTDPNGKTTTLYGEKEALRAVGATSIQYLD